MGKRLVGTERIEKNSTGSEDRMKSDEKIKQKKIKWN